MIQLPFLDREEAAHALADALARFRGTHPVIVAIPRGAVSMGRIVADALQGELDVVLVRKLGEPGNPEHALGAVDENGSITLNDDVAWAGASDLYLDREAQAQVARIREFRSMYGPAGAIDLQDRTVIVLDDGLATGATMEAALRTVRVQRPAHLVCAVPVAATEGLRRVESLCDHLVCLATPTPFRAISAYYRNFAEVQDREVVLALGRPPRPKASAHAPVRVRQGTVELEGELFLPQAPKGLVIFGYDGTACRYCARSRFMAETLHERGIATLLFDLLTPQEDAARSPRFDPGLMQHRLEAAVAWAAADPRVQALPRGLFGANAAGAAALRVAAGPQQGIAAVALRAGRPDLVQASTLLQVQVPVLLIVGGADVALLEANRAASQVIGGHATLEVIPGAGHLFVEPGAMGQVASAAARFFAASFKASEPVAG